MIAAFLMVSVAAFSQKIFTEGVLQYNISVVNGKDQPAIAKAFDGATQTVWFKTAHVRVDFISPLRNQATLFDAKDGSVVILKESGQEKYMMNLNKSEWSQYNRKYAGVAYKYLAETKTVAGYVCKKAIGTLKDGSQIVVFYCPDLMPYSTGYEYAFIEIPGLPLEYEISQGSLTVNYTVTSIQTNPVSMSKFDLPTSGYKILEYNQR